MERPAAYAEGYAEFFGRKFSVDPRVLIPRLETETLVRLAKRWIAEKGISTLVDVGTGSGIVALTLAKECPDRLARVHAADVSADALEVAQENRRRLGVACDFWHGDLLEPILSAGASFAPEGRVLFAANLPYIPDGDPRVGADVRAFEPALALYGGPETGFETYERLFSQTKEFARKFPGNPACALCEMGEGQRPAAEAALARLGLACEFFPDLSGVERFVGVADIRP